MEVAHFEAAKNGSMDKFPFCDINKRDMSEIFKNISPSGNTLLHISSSFGHEEMTELIAGKFPFLITQQNVEGNTALHLAVMAKKLNIVRILVHLAKQTPTTSTTDVALLTIKNEEGNSALHEALLLLLHSSMKRGDTLLEIVCYLLLHDPKVSGHQNNAGKSPFYLAVELGNKEILESILKALPRGNSSVPIIEGKSPVSVAIMQKQLDVLQLITKQKEELLLVRDEEMNSPLHCAASVGYLEGVRHLLKINSNGTIERNEEGFYPLHLACQNGHIKVMNELFRKWPDPTELLCKKGSSILHVAAKNGKEDAVRYILKEKGMDKLVNKMDKDGNTPLHLAALHQHSMVVSTLLSDERTMPELVNYQGLTAYDMICKSNTFEKASETNEGRNLNVGENSVAVDHLKSSKEPNEFQKMMTLAILYFHHEWFPRKRIQTKTTYRKSKSTLSKQELSNRINNLFVVAALIVGMAFSGSLQVPLDDESSTDETILSNFILGTDVAMYLSLTAALTLSLALFVDHNLANLLVWIAFISLGLALSFIYSAFRWAMTLRKLTYHVDPDGRRVLSLIHIHSQKAWIELVIRLCFFSGLVVLVFGAYYYVYY